jgi:hypothetical protein
MLTDRMLHLTLAALVAVGAILLTALIVLELQ